MWGCCERLGAELNVGLGKLDLGDLDLSEGKRLARRAVELIENGVVGYTLIAARCAFYGQVRNLPPRTR